MAEPIENRIWEHLLMSRDLLDDYQKGSAVRDQTLIALVMIFRQTITLIGDRLFKPQKGVK